jgi:alanine dehydrogenase
MARKIGVPREVKEDEGRIALSPAGVHELVGAGHVVLVERHGGEASGFDDAEYESAGAALVSAPAEIYHEADIVVKVKEPLESERRLIRPGQIVFTFFHFAASRELTDAMLESGATCVAYETIEASDGRLPLLTPMSEVAGRMAVFEGSKCLESPLGGRGVLISGIPGVEPARVVILGGGVVGLNSAKLAAGLGAQVVIFDIDLERLRYLSDVLPPNVVTMFSTPYDVRRKVYDADLVIGAVLVHGGKAPVLVTREDVARMKEGAVIIDVAVDQGGSVETCRPTTHSHPTYAIDGVLHYCVGNMPGALPRTSTLALTNATFPYLKALAQDGLRSFLALGPGAGRGLNIHRGKIYHDGVAAAFQLPFQTLEELRLS